MGFKDPGSTIEQTGYILARMAGFEPAIIHVGNVAQLTRLCDIRLYLFLVGVVGVEPTSTSLSEKPP